MRPSADAGPAAPPASRILTVGEFRRRERELHRGYPLAIALLALGAALTATLWAIGASRVALLDALPRPATRAEIDEIVAASSLEAELLLLGAGLVWAGIIVAVATAHLLARLRSRAAVRR